MAAPLRFDNVRITMNREDGGRNVIRLLGNRKYKIRIDVRTMGPDNICTSSLRVHTTSRPISTMHQTLKVDSEEIRRKHIRTGGVYPLMRPNKKEVNAAKPYSEKRTRFN
ncbi:unnamed protein product [Caenorhabditis brenneri]